MFNDLKDIEIAGGCYQEGSRLEDVLARPINIIYGKNGSGKSSLAKAFYEYANNLTDPSFPLDLGRNLTDEERDRIKVFDEDYVNRNVLVEGDELESIVMLGDDQIKNAEKISQLTEKSDALLARKVELEAAVSVTDAEKADLEKTVLNKLTSAQDRLKAARGFKKRQGLPLETVCAARLNEMQFSEDIVQLTNEVNEETTRLQSGMGGTEIRWYRRSVIGGVDIDAVKDLLGKKLRSPELSAEDEDLLRIATEQFHYIEEARRELIDKGATRCPLCQQPLTNDYLSHLSERIRMVLNEEADELKNALHSQSLRIGVLSDDVPEFPNDGYAVDVALYKSAVAKLNMTMAALKSAIEQKIGNLYGELEAFDFDALNDAVSLVDTYARKLEADVDKHNAVVADSKNLKALLEKKILWLAYRENEDFLSKIVDLNNKSNKLKAALDEVNTMRLSLKAEVEEVIAAARNIKVALNYINQCIAFVFADPNRLRLEPTNSGKYSLLSRGTPVPPHKVSVGERNIIALSYYFAKLNEGADVSSRNPVLMVIDDPVSSFDAGNKVGILSLLKWQIGEYFEKQGANECKVLLMSHDLLTVHDFESIYGELSSIWSDGREDAAVFELHRRSFRGDRVYSEYSTMLRNIYYLAKANDPDSDGYLGMGNTMRRVLESFAKIMYNRAYTTALQQGFFLNEIYCLSRPGESDEMYSSRVRRKVEYYDSLALRELFNAESHATVTIDFDSFESHFAGAELQKYARSVFLMLLYSNRHHLKSYLGDRMFNDVASWVDVVDGL